MQLRLSKESQGKKIIDNAGNLFGGRERNGLSQIFIRQNPAVLGTVEKDEMLTSSHANQLSQKDSPQPGDWRTYMSNPAFEPKIHYPRIRRHFGARAAAAGAIRSIDCSARRSSTLFSTCRWEIWLD